MKSLPITGILLCARGELYEVRLKMGEVVFKLMKIIIENIIGYLF